MGKKFWLDLLERAIKSFLQAFALSWTTAVAALPEGTVPSWGPLAFAGAMAGLSAVMSLASRKLGDHEDASAVNLEAIPPPLPDELNPALVDRPVVVTGPAAAGEQIHHVSPDLFDVGPVEAQVYPDPDYDGADPAGAPGPPPWELEG